MAIYRSSNVGNYLSTIQGVGLDWMNGVLSANNGIGIPLIGLGANMGTRIEFPSIEKLGRR